MTDVLPADLAHTAHSSSREKVLEHLLIGELLRCMWRKGIWDMEVLRGEVDMAGYDIVFEAGGIIRHVQLKSCHRTATTSQVGINVGLAKKPSGCVIWTHFDPITLELGPFLWFGGAPGAPLPGLGEVVGKHTKANREGVKAERPNIRVLKRRQFTVLPNVEALVDALFGKPQ
jgi:hypothetical protein